MSEQNKHLEIAALRQRASQQLEEAQQEAQAMAKLRDRAISRQLEDSWQMLEQIEAIDQLRRQVNGLLLQAQQLEGFEAEERQQMGQLAKQLMAAPLFHPQYEEILARKALASRDPEQNFEHQLREETEERLEQFEFSPGPEESDAIHSAYQALKSRPPIPKAAEAAYQESQLPPLVALALELEESSLQFLQGLENGMKAHLRRRKRERQLLENSSFGRKAQQGLPNQSLEELASLRHLLEKVKAVFEDAIRRNGPSPLLEELVNNIEEEVMDQKLENRIDAFLDDMLDESEGLMFSEDFGSDAPGWLLEFDEEDEELWEPVEAPLFPIGSSVEVIDDAYLYESRFPKLGCRGWQGRIVDAMTNGQVVAYEVKLDSLTLQAFPKAFIEYACEEEYGSFSHYEFTEEQLRPAPPRDSEEEARAVHRRLFHQHFWSHPVADEQAFRILDIMMRQPAATDEANWLAYFQQEVEYPLKARVEGLVLHQIDPGTPVEIVGIEGLDQEDGFGLIASIRKGRAIISYPLMELLPWDEKDPRLQPLLDYRYWADLML